MKKFSNYTVETGSSCFGVVFENRNPRIGGCNRELPSRIALTWIAPSRARAGASRYGPHPRSRAGRRAASGRRHHEQAEKKKSLSDTREMGSR